MAGWLTGVQKFGTAESFQVLLTKLLLRIPSFLTLLQSNYPRAFISTYGHHVSSKLSQEKYLGKADPRGLPFKQKVLKINL